MGSWSESTFVGDVVLPLSVQHEAKRGAFEPLADLTILTNHKSSSAIVLDYGRCEGGLPEFRILSARADGDLIEFDVVYSEGEDGVHHENGDGPFFLFSNAMNTYRRENHSFKATQAPITLLSRYTQQSQRFQKIILKSPNASITFSAIGLRPSRKSVSVKCSFSCSDPLLNKIYSEGVRTVEMCTLTAKETPEVWEVTREGTRIFGQHWAPCRQGTRWGDVIIQFEVRIEQGGASWGVRMVANGIIFCLDAEKRSIDVFEGLSHVNTVFPTKLHACWTLPEEIQLNEWITVEVEAIGGSLVLKINGSNAGKLHELNLHPLLGGAANNQGSVAFGGPNHFIALYRNLLVTSSSGGTLYENDFLLGSKERTLTDFQVGTNNLACTIDGAKRDRTVFGGDLYVMGRSTYYSTLNIEAIAGSLTLLTSHQTPDGYLGNLCPVQAPCHTNSDDPPTYAFYSLSYALLLLVAIKDYWLHTGDEYLVSCLWEKLDKLIGFAEHWIDARGLIVAPPPFQMDWFPLGGPVFGASTKINLAYYEALKSLAQLANALGKDNTYTIRASRLKDSIISNLWDSETRIMKMGDMLPPTGISQDINSYATTLGIAAPPLSSDYTSGGGLPVAYINVPGFDRVPVVSPYASGFAAEASFTQNNGPAALSLIRKVWGVMADSSSGNYSGAHWEAMKPDGTPWGHDTSLVHGWSTWPVFLLPRYLAGIVPLEAGWKRWAVKPVLAALSAVDAELETVRGKLGVKLRIENEARKGCITVNVPAGTTCEVSPPAGWKIEQTEVVNNLIIIKGNDLRVDIVIAKI